MLRRRDKKGKLEGMKTFGPRQAQAVKTYRAAVKATKGKKVTKKGARRMAQLKGRATSYNAAPNKRKK